jgi:hypothetical protein
MGTDYWPEKDGQISDGLVVGFCKAEGSITLHTAVKISASAASCITVDEAGWREGVGVALKAADTNDFLPVMFYGIMKAKVDTAAAISVMNHVVSGTTAGDFEAMTAISDTTWDDLGAGYLSGEYHKIGLALQAGTTDADEFLLLVGGAR